MRRHWLIPLLWGGGALLRLVIAWLPLEWQLTHILCDDTFYYLTIARQIARTGMISFDGLAATNGFHPLWLVLVVPFYLLHLNNILSIHAVLTFCAILDSLSMLMLHRILHALDVGTVVATTVLAMYALSPLLLSYAGPLNGLETSLNILMLFTLAYQWIAHERGRVFWWSTPAAVGAVAGVVVLSRTDNAVVLTGIFLIWCAVGKCRRVHDLMIIGMSAFLVSLPWLVWNLWMFNSPIQVSGEAFSLPLREILGVSAWGMWDHVTHIAGTLADAFRFFPFVLPSETKYSPLFLAQGSLMIALATLSAFWTRRNPEDSSAQLFIRNLRFCAPFAGGAFLFLVVHALHSVSLRGWYYATLMPLLLPLTASAADVVAAHVAVSVRRGGAVIVVGMTVVLLVAAALPGTSRTGEADKYAAIPVMARSIPPGMKVGSWNAGIYGYFYEGGPVVNLDGLVNNRVFPFLRSRTLASYCQQNDVRIIVDMAGAFRFWDPYWASPRGTLLSTMVIQQWLAAPGNDRSVVIVWVAPSAR